MTRNDGIKHGLGTFRIHLEAHAVGANGVKMVLVNIADSVSADKRQTKFEIIFQTITAERFFGISGEAIVDDERNKLVYYRHLGVTLPHRNARDQNKGPCTNYFCQAEPFPRPTGLLEFTAVSTLQPMLGLQSKALSCHARKHHKSVPDIQSFSRV